MVELKHKTLSEIGDEKVYATFSDEGCRITVVNLATLGNMVLYLPKEQVEIIYNELCAKDKQEGEVNDE